jgi:hypothetical protein
MKIIEHNAKEYWSIFGYDKYIHFYESKEKPGYYLMIIDSKNMGMSRYHCYNKTEQNVWGDGCISIPLAEPISIGPFSSNLIIQLEFFILDHFVEEHIPHEREYLQYRAWYKFKAVEPEKWLDDFIEQLKKKEAEYEYLNAEPIQLSLF